MGKFTWSKEQSDAINLSGQNMLISAGAGSGKTAVLTERIYQKVLNGLDISRLLVLTFTNAAAKEMKERVRKKISSDKDLTSELYKIDSADITTFDAFSLKIVKKYSYYLNLGTNIRIADAGVIALKKEEILKSILEEYYTNGDKRVFNYLEHFTTKDDGPLIKNVLRLYDGLSLLSDTDSFINNYEKHFFSSKKLDEIYEAYFNNINIIYKEALDAFEKARNAADLDNDKALDKYDTIINKLSNLSTTSSMYEAASSLKYPTKTKKSTEIETEYKEIGKEKIKELLKSIKNETKEESINEILNSKETVLLLLEISKKLQTKLDQYKFSENSFDFIDIAKLAINLVKEYPIIREELKSNYDEILIDEYQDTSDLQEELMNLIGDNNLYMVGDIKQSIYRFRNANPYIFKKKYEDYEDGNGGIKIDLTKNFRSRSEVLSDINFIYNDIMTLEHGDADYSKSHKMIFGFEAYNSHMDENFNYHTKVIEEEINEEGKVNCPNFRSAEKEAFYIAKDIKEKMESLKIFDNNTLRKVQYSDFTILIDKSKDYSLFKKILEFNNIPTVIMANEDLTKSYMSNVLVNLLTILEILYSKKSNKFVDSTNEENEKQEDDKHLWHAVTSILRSYLIDISETEIFRIVRQRDYNNIVMTKMNTVLDKIDSLSSTELFKNLLDEFNVIELLTTYGDTEKSLIEIEYVNNMIKEMSNIGKSILDASSTLNEIINKDLKISYSIDESKKNAVKIMTIHKSKGLEFPIVYFPTLNNKINKQEYISPIIFNSEFGIFHKTFNNGIRDNIILDLIKEDSIKKDVSERIRLLYVAMTRTKEHMVIFSEYTKKARQNIFESQSFNDFFSFTTLINKDYIDYAKYDLTKDYLEVSNINELPYNNSNIYKPIVRNNKPIVKRRASKIVNKLNSSETIKNINLGLEFHSALESIDFSKMSVEELPSSDFVKNTLRSLFKHSIFSNISHAKTFKEHEFSYIVDGEVYHGIIDLLVVYEDHVDIIDYKLKATVDKAYEKQLSVYKAYTKQKTNKEISCYLLSILDKEITKVEVI